MTIKIQPAQTITDGIVMSKEAFLEVNDDVPIAFTKNLNYYVVTGLVKIMTASVEQPAKGCACRWDADDNRVATCTRHQGWLDVVQEWADRAKEAESKLAQPEPCTNDEWLANCPQKVRDFAAKVKAEKEQK